MQSKTWTGITLFGLVPEIQHFWHQNVYEKNMCKRPVTLKFTEPLLSC